MALGINEEYRRCPICHSPIGVYNTVTDTDRDLTDEEVENLESQGIYVWTHDPIKTKRGLSGEDYIGLYDIKITDIQELQETRQQQEIDAGIEEANQTTFTSISAKQNVKKNHIRELRQSTEKILGITDLSTEEERENILENYFNYDEEGNELGTQEYGETKTNKKEWKRVNRNISGHLGEPYFPENKQYIYALDIEELRHPLMVGWYEDFTGISPTYNGSGSLGISGGDIEDEDWDDDLDYFHKSKNLQLFDGDVTTLKSNKIDTDAHSITTWSGINTWLGSGSTSLLVNINKPISAQCYASASVSHDEEHLGGWAQVGTLSQLQMIWEEDQFNNPSPYPNKRIIPTFIGVLNYNCVTYARGSSAPTPGAGSASGGAGLALEFTFYDATTDIYPKLHYSFANPDSEYQSGWYIYKIIALGEQEVELDFYNHLKTAGYDVDNHQIYFVRQILVRINANASTYYINFPDTSGGSGYGQINVTVSKFGLKRVVSME